MDLSWLEDFLSSSVMQFVFNIFTFVPKIVYFIVACFLSLIDLFQVVFRKLAGLDVVMISGEAVKGDPVYTIISDALFRGKYPAISTTFWSLIILGVVMVFATTFIAVIRVEIVPDKEKKNNSKEGIIRNFFVALFNLAIVPISCIFALYLGNAMIGVIDQAISTNEVADSELMKKFDKWTWDDYGGDSLRQDYDEGGLTESEVAQKDKYESYIAFDIFGHHVPTTMEPFSATMFKACAAPCNRLNKYGEGYLDALNNANVFGIFDGSITESSVAADLIDTGFMYSAKLKLPASSTGYSLVYDDNIEQYCTDWMKFIGSTENITCFSRYNPTMVWYFYDLWTFNYIVAFAALSMMLRLYWQFALSLMARLFEITGLFLVAPIPVGITPLDGGGTLARWRQRFYSKFMLMLIMVLGLNLINPLITLVHNIKLFNVAFLDYIILAFFIVAALNAMDSLNNTLSFILFDKAGENEYKNAKDQAKAIQGTFNTGLASTAKVAGMVTSAPFKVAGAGIAIGRGGINAAQNVRSNSQERRAIQTGMAYNRAQQQHNFNRMSEDDRRAWARNFMDTDEGRALLSNFNGSDDATRMRNMEEAIATNNFRGKIASGSPMNADDMRDQMYEFRHRENVFQHSDMASGLTAGTAEYNAAMADFNSMNQRQQVAHLMNGDSALTTNQANIRAAREQRQQRYEEGPFRRTRRVMSRVGNAISVVTQPIDKHVGQPVKKVMSPILSGMFGWFGDPK